jgi:tryptophan synthase alpha chain
MGYYNPILSFGEDAFVRAAKSAGADGFIVPDLPPDEAAEFGAMAESAGLALIHMLAPTSDDERMMKVIESARGFIYLVSLTGVTGARTDVQRGLAGFVDRVRSKTTTPLAVGFGISTPQQVRQVGEMADGVIVGSALIDAVDRAADSAGAAGSYVRSLRAALHQEK